MKDRTVLIVQARMGSERLPGKVMKTVLNRPLLAYLLSQLSHVRRVDQIVVATSTELEEQPISDLCGRLGVSVFYGPLHDVLRRFSTAASAYQADVVVRICADCPLLDPAIVDRVIAFYQAHQGDFDYVSNCLVRTYPRGQDVEVISRTVLEKANVEARRPEEREHVTPYLYRHPEIFRLGNVTHPIDLSAHRWVVDTKEDFIFISRILEALVPNHPVYGMHDVLAILERHPDWIKINAHIAQKGVDR